MLMFFVSDWMYSPPIVLPGATPSEKMTPITVAQNNGKLLYYFNW